MKAERAAEITISQSFIANVSPDPIVLKPILEKTENDYKTLLEL